MSTISSGTTLTTALVQTGDTTGELVIKTNNGNTTAATFSTGGNLIFGATGARIQGDFSNATVANRVMFQTSTTNGNTIVGAVPNGTASTAVFRAFNSSSDTVNVGQITFGINSTNAFLAAGALGSGTQVPLGFEVNGSERLRIDTSGNVGIGTSSPSFGLTVQRDNGSGYVAGFRSASGSPMLTIQNTGGISQIQGLNSALSAVADIALQVSGGNVGIGTSSPSARLAIGRSDSSSEGGQIDLCRASDNASSWAVDVFGNTSTPDFRIVDNIAGVARIQIGSAGQLGIGGANYGTSGQVLTSNGSGSAPSWQTATVNGTAKAWVSFNGTNGSIRGSFNVSSISVNGTGDYSVNFTSALSTANYAKACTPSGISGQGDLTAINTDRKNNTVTAPTTSSFRIFTNVIGSAQNPEYVSATAFA